MRDLDLSDVRDLTQLGGGDEVNEWRERGGQGGATDETEVNRDDDVDRGGVQKLEGQIERKQRGRSDEWKPHGHLPAQRLHAGGGPHRRRARLPRIPSPCTSADALGPPAAPTTLTTEVEARGSECFVEWGVKKGARK